MTEYEYDDDGRLVRSVTTETPRFSTDDFWAMVERRRAKSALCGGCGHPRDDAWVTEGLDDDEVRRRDRRYRAVQIECAACAKADRKRGAQAVEAGRHTYVRDLES